MFIALSPGPWQPSCRQPTTFSSWELGPPPLTHGTIGRIVERGGHPLQTPLTRSYLINTGRFVIVVRDLSSRPQSRRGPSRRAVAVLEPLIPDPPRRVDGLGRGPGGARGTCSTVSFGTSRWRPLARSARALPTLPETCCHRRFEWWNKEGVLDRILRA